MEKLRRNLKNRESETGKKRKEESYGELKGNEDKSTGVEEDMGQ